MCCVFIQQVVCLTTGPHTSPKPVLHTVRTRTSSFSFQHLLFLRLPSSRLSPFHFLLLRSIYLSVTFWKALGMPDAANKVSLPFLIVGRASLSFLTVWHITYLTFHATDPADLRPSPAQHFKTLKAFLSCFAKCPFFSTVHSYALSLSFH